MQLRKLGVQPELEGRVAGPGAAQLFGALVIRTAAFLPGSGAGEAVVVLLRGDQRGLPLLTGPIFLFLSILSLTASCRRSYPLANNFIFSVITALPRLLNKFITTILSPMRPLSQRQSASSAPKP